MLSLELAILQSAIRNPQSAIAASFTSSAIAATFKHCACHESVIDLDHSFGHRTEKMATAFGVRLLGTALVVIFGFYKLPGRETRVDFLPIIARVS
jgi:hypothetical protein